MGDHVGEDSEADGLTAAVVSGGVGAGADEGCVEYGTSSEERVHPLATGEVGHDAFGVRDAVGFGNGVLLLPSADLFAV